MEGCYWGHAIAAEKPGQESLQVLAFGFLQTGNLDCGIKMSAVLQYLLLSPSALYFSSLPQLLLNFYSLQFLLGSRRLALLKPEHRIKTSLMPDCCLCSEQIRRAEGKAFFQFEPSRLGAGLVTHQQ